MIKVSVIIPVYNMERYLEECLDSVINQDLEDIEVICVDDGSTDNSLAVLKKYEQKDDRIVILSQENRGVSAARNRALLAAQGKYVCFMDPDDFYPARDVLRSLYEIAEREKVLICGGCFSEINNGKIKTFYEGNFAGYVFDWNQIIEYKDYQFDYGYHRFIYNREFLLRNEIFFPAYKRYQDPPFFVRAMIGAGRFYALNKVVYRYRCGFQESPEAWSEEKFIDMFHGFLDNLNLSRENKLAKLHLLTIRRIENLYVLKPSMHRILSGNFKVLKAIADLNAAVDINLVKTAAPDFRHDFYIIKELRDIIWHYQNASKASDDARNQYKEIKKIKEDMERSLSFRLGRIITYLPRKVRDALSRNT